MKMKVDDRELRNWKRRLKKLSKGAYPLAVRGTVNALALQTRKEAVIKQLPQKFTLRNKYIQRSVQYTKSDNTFKIHEMKSEVGQKARFLGNRTDQLKKQEDGGEDKAKGKYVKTGLSESRIGKSPAKAITKNKRIGNLKGKFVTEKSIRAKSKGTIKSTKNLYRAVGRLASAGKIPSKGQLLVTNKKDPSSKILFSYTALKKAKKREGRGSEQLTLKPLYKYQRRRTNRPRKWLEPATNITYKKVNELFVQQAKRRMDKAMRKKFR